MSASRQKKIINAAWPLGLLAGTTSLAQTEYLNQFAETVGWSRGLVQQVGAAFSVVGSQVFGQFFSDSWKDLQFGDKDNLQKVVLLAYKEALKDLGKALEAAFGLEETRMEKLKRLLLREKNEKHELGDEIKAAFLDPLYERLTSNSELSKFVDEHKRLDFSGYLKENVIALLTEAGQYVAGNEKDEQLADTITDNFQSLYQQHFLQELNRNEAAKTAYFTILMEGSLKAGLITQDILSRFVAESGLQWSEISSGIDVIQQSIGTLQQTVDEINAKISADKEPVLYNVSLADKKAIPESQLFNYKYEYTSFIGRNKEKSDLLNFIFDTTDTARFKWTLLTGPGGMGKSRMALELMKIASRAGFNAGFYYHYSNSGINWSSFRALRGTLMVIDYAMTESNQVKELIIALERQSQYFSCNVRLLLIDRKESADWGKIVQLPEVVMSAWDWNGKRSYELSSLSDHIWDLFAEVIDRSGTSREQRDLLINQKEEVLKSFRIIDPLQRPLFAFFAAKALVFSSGGSIRNWNVHQLLDFHIARSEEQYWMKLKGYKENKEHINLLLAMVTLRGGADERAMLKLTEVLELDNRMVEIVYQHIADVKSELYGESKYVLFSGIEPDILGEYFVIKTFSEYLDGGALSAKPVLTKLFLAGLKDFMSFLIPDVFFRAYDDLYADSVEFRKYVTVFDLYFETFLLPMKSESYSNYHAAFLFLLACKMGDYPDMQVKYKAKAKEVCSNLSGTLVGRARDYASVEDYSKSVELCSAAIEADHSSAIAYHYRAAYCYKLGQSKQGEQRKIYFDLAELDWKKALEITPTQFESLLSLGYYYYQKQGETDEVLELTQRAVQESCYSFYLMSESFLGVEPWVASDVPIIYNISLNAIKVAPGLLELLLNEGVEASRRNHMLQSLFYFDRVLDIDPLNYIALLLKGRSYTEIGKPVDAIKNFTQAIAIRPSLYRAYIRRADLMDDLKDYTSAIADYDAAIQINPHSAIAYNYRGITRFNQRKYKEAINDFTAAISLCSRYGNAYTNRGNAKRALLQYKEAEEDYTKAIEIAPSYDGYLKRANHYLKENNFRQAADDFKEAFERTYPFVDINIGRAVSLAYHLYCKVLLGELDMVVEQFQTAHNYNKKQDPQVYWLAGLSKFLMEMDNEAADEFNALIDLWPADWKGYFGNGILAYFKEDYEGARESIKKAISLGMPEEQIEAWGIDRSAL